MQVRRLVPVLPILAGAWLFGQSLGGLRDTDRQLAAVAATVPAHTQPVAQRWGDCPGGPGGPRHAADPGHREL